MTTTTEPPVKHAKIYLPFAPCAKHGRILALYPNAVRLPYFPCPECVQHERITAPAAQPKPFGEERTSGAKRHFERTRVTFRGTTRLAWKHVLAPPVEANPPVVARKRKDGRFVKIETSTMPEPSPYSTGVDPGIELSDDDRATLAKIKKRLLPEVAETISVPKKPHPQKILDRDTYLSQMPDGSTKEFTHAEWYGIEKTALQLDLLKQRDAMRTESARAMYDAYLADQIARRRYIVYPVRSDRGGTP